MREGKCEREGLLLFTRYQITTISLSLEGQAHVNDLLWEFAGLGMIAGSEKPGPVSSLM